jgi:hypothetical protein
MRKRLFSLLTGLLVVLFFAELALATPPVPCPGCDNPNLKECESGLDLEDAWGPPGATVSVVIKVKNAPNKVSAFGFDVCYPSNILTYNGPIGTLALSDPHRGDPLSGWYMVGINVIEPGRVRIGGLTTPNPIEAGETGSLIILDFTISEGADPSECHCLSIFPESKKDHVEAWPVCWGEVCIPCPHDGDVNMDEEVTPRDALMTFKHYLGIIELDECQQDHAEVCNPVDPGSNITPQDALCIFVAYLDGLLPQEPLPCGVCD